MNSRTLTVATERAVGRPGADPVHSGKWPQYSPKLYCGHLLASGDCSQLGGGTTGSSDLLLGGAGELVDRHLDGDSQVAVAENLDELVLANGALGNEILDRDLPTLGEQTGDV